MRPYIHADPIWKQLRRQPWRGGSRPCAKAVGLVVRLEKAPATQAGSGFVSTANAFLILNTALIGRLEMVFAGRVYRRHRNHAHTRDPVVNIEFSSAIKGCITRPDRD